MRLDSVRTRGSSAGLYGWSRRYPPLLVSAVALILAVFALPSALNLPQANPGQTLEYAPVPGDSNQAAPGGNLAGLGLGSSGILGAGLSGGAAGLGGLLPDLTGTGATPSTKHCVGRPPRQTEDPLSPPCVAVFKGDNGGATYQGVTRDEIRILLYIPGGNSQSPTDQGTETFPAAQMYDLWQPTASNDNPLWVRIARVWQTYFGDRFQTYNRRPHLFVYFGSCGAASTGTATNCVPDENSVRADAAQNWGSVHPFATFDYGDYNNVYLAYMAGKGVLNFGGLDVRQASFFSSYPKLLWGFYPSAEVSAHLFATYICQKVQPFPVGFSGNNDLGSKRRYGLVYYGGQQRPSLTYMAGLVRREVEGCGIQFLDVAVVPVYGNAFMGNTDPSYAAPNMAQFKKDGITTIIWAGGYEPYQSTAAANIDYYPEWVVMGADHVMDEEENTSLQNQQVWSHAVVVTSDIPAGSQQAEPSCDTAYRSVNPNTDPNSPAVGYYACATLTSYYDDLLQLFTAVQVAGPHLDPDYIDQGMHAIPALPARGPASPACYYLPGDYTCVKDATVEWWDPTQKGGAAEDFNGCYREMELGRRYVAGQWPTGDVFAQRSTSSDPCNTY